MALVASTGLATPALAAERVAASTPPAAVATADRHALLLANADYPGQSRDLANPVNDARLLERALVELGFQVTRVDNSDRATLRQAVTRFTEALPTNATAFVYYAGHGVQVGGTNYLLPTDANLRNEASVASEAYPLKTLLERLASARSAVNLVVLDACRNNPFQPPPGVRHRNWSLDGLAKAPAPRGTLIAYSTAPGEVAADGTGAHSLFAEALARQLPRTELPVEQVFKRVGAWVRQQTRDEQIPWVESSLTTDLYLRPPAGVKTVAVSRELAAGPGLPRGTGRGVTVDAGWAQRLSASEWAELDWSIQQRVKGLTADELPALERKARAGSVVAITTLGLAHREGIQRSVNERTGVTRSQANNTLAVQWLRRAADAGFAVAQTELAEMHFKGHGVDRNLARSRALLEQAAAAGYPRASLNLAHLQVVQNPTPESMLETGRALGTLLQQLRMAPAKP